MVRRCFGDAELARSIGRGTWPVRVDVDRRPDLAERFGVGGWPSTAILTPDADWMTGSTYLDPEDLRELLRRVRVYFNSPKRWGDFERARRNLARWVAREATDLPREAPATGLLRQFADSTVLARVDTAAAVELGDALAGGLYAPQAGLFVAGLAGFSEQSGEAVLLKSGLAAPRDPAVYTSWNALAVTGFVALYRASGTTAYLDLARDVLASVRTRLTHPDGGVRHVLHPPGEPLFLLADQALVARAALDLYSAGGGDFRFASELADVMLERLFDDAGALRDRWPEPDVAVIHAVDRLVPSGNGVAVQVLSRLYALTGHSRYRETAGEILETLANSHLRRAPNAGALFRGMAMYLRPGAGRASRSEPREFQRELP